MFWYVAKRTWANALIYFVVIAALPYATFLGQNVIYGLSAFATVRFLYTLYKNFRVEATIASLGKHAPTIGSYAPFGLDTLARAVYAFSQWRNHDFWYWAFAFNKNPNYPWTVEDVTVGQRIIFTADEENVKAILATKFADYGKGDRFREEWKDFLGLSIFTTDGDRWHNSRMLLRPQFIKDRVSDLQTFENHIQVLLPMLAGSHKGATVRIDDLFYRFTLDAATAFLLGASVNSLQDDSTAFAEAFTEVSRVQALIARAGPLNSWVPRKKFRAGLKVLNDFVNKYVDQALQLSPDELEKTTKSDDGYTFLHAIASYTRDRQVLRDQIVAILLAGRDTTSVTLSWLFYELSRHPEVVQKLQKEIQSFVGLDREPTYADLKSMRYLQHTLNETLRLYPVYAFTSILKRSASPLTHRQCSLQRKSGSGGHHAPSRRWQRRHRAHRHRQRHVTITVEDKEA